MLKGTLFLSISNVRKVKLLRFMWNTRNAPQPEVPIFKEPLYCDSLRSLSQKVAISILHGAIFTTSVEGTLCWISQYFENKIYTRSRADRAWKLSLVEYRAWSAPWLCLSAVKKMGGQARPTGKFYHKEGTINQRAIWKLKYRTASGEAMAVCCLSTN